MNAKLNATTAMLLKSIRLMVTLEHRLTAKQSAQSDIAMRVDSTKDIGSWYFTSQRYIKIDYFCIIVKYSKEKIFYPGSRFEWRSWLSEHYDTQTEIWLVFPNINSGEAGVSYNDAVEEALCFGWIDGIAGRLDDTHSLRRFTPRRKGSSYSRPNIERLIWLDEQNLLQPEIRDKVLPVISTPYQFPDDIMSAIKKDSATMANFRRFTPSYQRIRISYIDDARKRPDEFAKRLEYFLKKTKENKLITGYGGIDKYYSIQQGTD